MKRAVPMLLILALLCCTACSTAEPVQTPAPTPARTPAPTQPPVPTAAATATPRTEPEIDLDLLLGMTLEAVTDYSSVFLPPDSGAFSFQLAQQALTLCTGHDREQEAAVVTEGGFTLLAQVNYDKAMDDPAHTCAYTVATQPILRAGLERTLLLVAIRGTNGAEWDANFDVAPSHTDDSPVAENFWLAAEDVLQGLEGLGVLEEDPVVLVCGHSRGAACANLLALLLNQRLGAEDVFAYTFATPATVRSQPEGDCSNIFNVINPCDVVPMVPLAGWGFTRAGRDILLPGDPEQEAALENAMSILLGVAPDLTRYYGERHALDRAGLSEDGMSAYELMLGFSKLLQSGFGAPGGSGALPEISPESDLSFMNDLMSFMMRDGGGQVMQIMGQHMPAVYSGLLEALLATGDQG